MLPELDAESSPLDEVSEDSSFFPFVLGFLASPVDFLALSFTDDFFSVSAFLEVDALASEDFFAGFSSDSESDSPDEVDSEDDSFLVVFLEGAAAEADDLALLDLAFSSLFDSDSSEESSEEEVEPDDVEEEDPDDELEEEVFLDLGLAAVDTAAAGFTAVFLDFASSLLEESSSEVEPDDEADVELFDSSLEPSMSILVEEATGARFSSEVVFFVVLLCSVFLG